jgi:hypothetical protein
MHVLRTTRLRAAPRLPLPKGPGAGGWTNDGEDPTVCLGATAVGLDRSGFVRLMYPEAADYDALGPGGTDDQIVQGAPVPAAQAIPGDLVLFGTSTGDADHMGIHPGVINGVPERYDAFGTGADAGMDPVSRANTPDHPLLGYRHDTTGVAVAA